MPEQILMINARLSGKNTAAALFFKNSEKLFGRYWGSLADYQFLHFETCYYQGQEYAIANALQSLIQAHRGSIKYSEALSRFLRIPTTGLATKGSHWRLTVFCRRNGLTWSPIRMRRGVCCLFAGKTSCCQFEFVQQAATDLEYCGNQNNNQIRKELA